MLSDKLCECGCGGLAPIQQRTNARHGHIKGQPQRFILGHVTRTRDTRGEKNRNWKGGRKISGGYISILQPDHPRAVRGYVPEHILMAEAALGHPLPPKAEVHHANGITHDNVRNLVICQDRAYHKLLHLRMRALKLTSNPNVRKCWICKRWDIDVHAPRKGTGGYHKVCKAQYDKERHAHCLRARVSA